MVEHSTVNRVVPGSSPGGTAKTKTDIIPYTPPLQFLQMQLIKTESLSVLSQILSRGRAVVARQAHNLKVVGSNPTPATKFGEKMLGEHHLNESSFWVIAVRVAPLF